MVDEDKPQFETLSKEEPKKEPLEVHTMPEKFIMLEKKAKEGKVGKPLIIVLSVMVVGVLIAAGIFVFQKYITPKPVNENVNALVVVNNVNNVNQNTNANQNVNQNVNKNVNVNRNLNANLNLNLFNINNANQNVNLNANIAIPASKDSDLDDLTDVEETLYGTNAQKADTDDDSYADGQEIANGYNPNGLGKLEEMPEDKRLVTKYTSSTLNFTVLYPASWIRDNDPQNPEGVIFSTTTGEFISINPQENPASLSARDWYLAQSPGIDTTKVKSLTNWARETDKKLQGAKSLDGYTVYYVKEKKAYVIHYNTNVLSEANFPATFEMVYRSFQFVTPITNLNANVNANTNVNANLNKNTNSNVNTNLNANKNTNTNI